MFRKVVCFLFLLWAVGIFHSGILRAEQLEQIKTVYQPDMSKGMIFVSKKEMKLTLFDEDGQVVRIYPMACGKNIGQKRVAGDMKTPEGKFSLQSIEEASRWGHDFNDGKGYIQHAYGPWFMRLKTKFSGIGIHGTHAPESIGTRATEGCIRLNNDDLSNLKPLVRVGMTVIIGPENGIQIQEDVPVFASVPATQTALVTEPVKAVAIASSASPKQKAKPTVEPERSPKQELPAQAIFVENRLQNIEQTEIYAPFRFETEYPQLPSSSGMMLYILPKLK